MQATIPDNGLPERDNCPHCFRQACDVDEITRTGRSRPQQWVFKDVDGDLDTDLILQFPTQQAGIQCGDTVALVKGSTIGGVPIEGSDSIRTVACP